MKHCFVKIAACIACVFLLISFVPTALAETQITELFTLDSTRNMAISVTYDTEPPAVVFIAPNGDRYDDAAVAAGKMSKTDSGEALFYRIPNAQAGTWTIEYDKKGNTDVTLNYAPYAESLVIEEFTFEQVDAGVLRATFLSTHTSNLYYQYKLYAVLVENNAVSGQKLLAEGNAYANDPQERTLHLNKLSTYDNYYLMLEVTGLDNGADVFDSAVTDKSFAHTNTNADAAPDNFYVELDVSQESLLINWKDTNARNRETLVSVFFDDAAEPNYYNTFTSDVTRTELAVDVADTATIRVEVSYKNSQGVSSQTAVRTIDMAVAKAVTLTTPDLTVSAQAEIVYDLTGVAGGPFKAQLQVNDDPVRELSLQGKDSFAVQLQSFDNTLSLVWQYTEYVAFKVSGSVYSDRLAPTLSIPDSADLIKTDRPTYVLAGTVNAGSTVTVNGNAVSVDENGIFTQELALIAGENVFTVIATGPNGNKTQQIVTVQYVLPGTIQATGRWGVVLQYWPLAVFAVFTVALGLFVLRARTLYARRRENKDVRVARLLLLRDCAVFLLVLAAVATAVFAALLIATILKANSVAFYDTAATEGVYAAYAILQLRRAYIIWTCVAAGCMALGVALCILFGNRAKKPPKEKVPKAPKPPKAPKAPKPVKPTASKQNGGCFCGACGTKNDPAAKFCKKCGHPLNLQ